MKPLWYRASLTAKRHTLPIRGDFPEIFQTLDFIEMPILLATPKTAQDFQSWLSKMHRKRK